MTAAGAERSSAEGADPSAAQRRIREEVWDRLRAVARPDSRFHWDFSSFIPDFEGSDACVEPIRALAAYRRAEVVFVTPDNCMETLRRAVLDDGKTLLSTSYGITRGFFVTRPEDVPPARREVATTLDGLERFARSVTVDDVAALGPLPLLVTGASAVTTTGLRLGKGHGFFDLEWALLWELRAVDATVEVTALVHDCQVVRADIPPAPHDVVVDWIVTPTGIRRVRSGAHDPGRVRWGDVDAALLESVPVLEELRARAKR